MQSDEGEPEKGLAVSKREIKRGSAWACYDAMIAQTMTFFYILITIVTVIADALM